MNAHAVYMGRLRGFRRRILHATSYGTAYRVSEQHPAMLGEARKLADEYPEAYRLTLVRDSGTYGQYLLEPIYHPRYRPER